MSDEISTRLIPLPPSNAIPRNSTGPAASFAPAARLVTNERTRNRLIGIVGKPVEPGATLLSGVSGMRYAVFIQKLSSVWSSTVIAESIFTQYVEYQPGTIKRTG